MLAKSEGSRNALLRAALQINKGVLYFAIAVPAFTNLVLSPD